MARNPPFVILERLVICEPKARRAYSESSSGFLVKAGMITHFFEDAGEVADGYPLRQQVLQNPLYLADAQSGGNQFIHHGGMGLFEVIQQDLDVLARQDFVAVPLDGFGEVGDQD